MTASETGAVISAEALQAVGIQPGDRLAFVRTTRGTLVVVPAVATPDGFLIGAHAQLHVDLLLTYNSDDFGRMFPILEVIVPPAPGRTP